MNEDASQFTQLYNALVAHVNADEWPAVRALLTAQLTANRGMQRTALVALKPIRHLEQIADLYNQLAAALRSTSANGTI